MSTSNYRGFAIAIIGENETGKTYYCDQIIKRYKRPVLAIMDDDSEEYFDSFHEIEDTDIKDINPLAKGSRFKIMSGNDRKQKETVCTSIYNDFSQNPKVGGLLFFDDAMTILDCRPTFVFPLFKKRRQRKFDIILNCHGFSEFPVNLVKNMTNIVVSKTADSTKAIESRMNSSLAKELQACIQIVNEIATVNRYFKLDFDIKKPYLFSEVISNKKMMDALILEEGKRFQRIAK